MKLACLTLAALFCASAARAYSIDAGIKETLGSSSYAGTSLYAKFKKDEWSLKPAFSTYHSSLSSGTYDTVSARLAYNEKRWGLGLTIGGSPQTNGYSNGFFGMDGGLTLHPTATGGTDEDEDELLRLDLGAGFTRTGHSDAYQLVSPATSAGRARRQTETVTARTNGSLKIAQTDLNVSAAAAKWENSLSIDFTGTTYDKDLNAVSARSAQILSLAGLDAVVQGFPKTSLSLRLENTFFPTVNPYLSYTHTVFAISQPPADIYAGGCYVDVTKTVEASLSYQRYTQSGLPGRNYFSLGVSAAF